MMIPALFQWCGGVTAFFLAIEFSRSSKVNALELQATYRGRFQYLRGIRCDGPVPVLRAGCADNASVIQVLASSHPSIQCHVDNETYSFVVCQNTCATEEECTDIWLETNTAKTPIDGVYGNITFTCTGSSIDAYFIYERTEEGSCGIGLNVRNYHIAQLGILCPGDVEYRFDGNLMECTSGEAFSARDQPFPRQLPGVYTCGSGDSCSNCEVVYDSVIIQVQEHRVPQRCITLLEGTEIPIVPAPTPSPSPPGDYSMSFQADWAVAYKTKAVCRVTDQEARPKITIKCLNGQIELVRTRFDTVVCEPSGDDTLICTEPTGDEFVGFLYPRTYSGVEFTCSGATLPEASAVMDSLNINCGGSTHPQVVPRLRLGIDCGDESSQYRYYDPFIECADGSNFDTPIQGALASLENPLEYVVYECNQILNFPDMASGTSQTLSTGSVGVFTQYDVDWDLDLCYTFQGEPTNKPTQRPSALLRSPLPTAFPTKRPWTDPTRRPTPAPP